MQVLGKQPEVCYVKVARGFDPCRLIEHRRVASDVGIDKCGGTIIRSVGFLEFPFTDLQLGKRAQPLWQCVKLATSLAGSGRSRQQRLRVRNLSARGVDIGEREL